MQGYYYIESWKPDSAAAQTCWQLCNSMEAIDLVKEIIAEGNLARVSPPENIDPVEYSEIFRLGRVERF